MEATQIVSTTSTDDWIKMWYIYTVDYYSAIKNKEALPFEAMLMDI